MGLMIDGLDVSHWQDPAKFDWPALKARGVKFVVCRASYGAVVADRDFKKFADAVRGHGLVFGAYLFYRQVHSVRDQLLLFHRQLELVGDLQPGELFPTLDMEENQRNGDGAPIASKFSSDCREIAESLRVQYGGVILYYSSFFPEYLGARTRPGQTLWMKEAGYSHWLADYAGKGGVPTPPGKPRTPYTPEWHIHQPRKTRIPEYAAGREDIDTNVLNPATSVDRLRIAQPLEVSDEAVEGEVDTTDRPGGCDFEDVQRGTVLIREGLDRIREGLDAIEKD